MLKTIVLGRRSLQRYKPPLQPRTAAHELTRVTCRQLSSNNEDRHGDQRPAGEGIDVWRHRIRGWSEQAAGSVKTHADSLAVSANLAMSRLGSQLNRMTGYDAIEALKKRVEEQGPSISFFIEKKRRKKK